MNIKRFVLAVVLAAGLCIWVKPGLAQQPLKGRLQVADSTFIQMVKTVDGSSNLGRIIRIDSLSVEFQTTVMTMTIPIGKIAEIKDIPVGSIKNGEYWFSNPNATRLFFGPTAHMLKGGEGYFSDTYIFFPQVVFGLTDNITMGGGMSLFPGGGSNQIVFFMPKVGMPVNEKFHLAGGALIIKVPDFDQDVSTVGVLYGVGTYGGSDRSFTAGLGYGFAGDEMADRPMVMVGGEYRMSRRVSFVTENWIFPGLDQPLVSAGFRFFGEGLAVDLALANVLGEDMITPGIPFIDFVYNF